MLVEAVLYCEGVRKCSGKLAEVADQARLVGGFVWAGLHDPATAEITEVADVFGLHPLAVEDAIKSRQRPKVERYGDQLFVVVKSARYLDEPEVVEFGEIQLFCCPTAIVVIRRGEPVPLAGVRQRLEADPDRLAGGPVAVLHAVIDEIVDAYKACLTGLDDDVSEVELGVFSDHGQNDAELVSRMYFLQREVLELHRAVFPLQGSLPALRADPLVAADQAWDAYFRDVDDHLHRETDQLQTLRELLGTALAANAAKLSLRQNEDMRRISAWVAIVAVPTMIAGIYGMNFEHMPELDSPAGYPLALGVMLVVCVSLYRWFRKSGWL